MRKAHPSLRQYPQILQRHVPARHSFSPLTCATPFRGTRGRNEGLRIGNTRVWCSWHSRGPVNDRYRWSNTNSQDAARRSTNRKTALEALAVVLSRRAVLLNVPRLSTIVASHFAALSTSRPSLASAILHAQSSLGRTRALQVTVSLAHKATNIGVGETRRRRTVGRGTAAREAVLRRADGSGSRSAVGESATTRNSHESATRRAISTSWALMTRNRSHTVARSVAELEAAVADDTRAVGGHSGRASVPVHAVGPVGVVGAAALNVSSLEKKWNERFEGQDSAGWWRRNNLETHFAARVAGHVGGSLSTTVHLSSRAVLGDVAFLGALVTRRNADLRALKTGSSELVSVAFSSTTYLARHVSFFVAAVADNRRMRVGAVLGDVAGLLAAEKRVRDAGRKRNRSLQAIKTPPCA